MNRHECEIEGCPREWKYKLYKTFADGEKKWIKVCALHEAVIGKENLRRVKGEHYNNIKR